VTVDDATLLGTLDELGAGLRAGEFTVRELTEASLDRLERVGPELNAVVTVTRDRALSAADELDAELSAGEDRGPLHGVPFGVKDLLAVEGRPTTWGAAPLADREREREGTATVVERLEAAGAVLVGKLAMVELAGGLGYERADASFTGPGLTPWDPGAWSGGSSSGAGSAVPTGLVGFAVGSETWGSIVGPATYCGVVGLRPTYGRVSRAGAMALSWTMDKLGPLCRSVDGCAAVLEAMAGPDPADDTTTDRPLAGGAGSPPRVAVVDGAADDAQPGVRENYEASLATLREFATVETVELPDYPYAEAARTVISAEAAAAFEDLVESGATEELTAPADRIGAYANEAVLAKDYLNAMRVRRLVGRDLDALLEPFDALVTPSAETVAIPVEVPFAEYREPYEIPPVGAAANLAGLPAVAVPNGFGERDCPTGVTFTGRAYDDRAVLDVARAYESRTDHVSYADLLDRFPRDA
jgi:aspartyl-tRNA(Asn)/glutamyl-tRNA(Gln) amidotransferase subunit A